MAEALVSVEGSKASEVSLIYLKIFLVTWVDGELLDSEIKEDKISSMR